MKLYGVEMGKKYVEEDALELEEMFVVCKIEEIDKLIQFLKNVKAEHSGFEGSPCHSHLRDWDKEWKKSDGDIIIVTE